jgi:hypothetical protein
VIYVIYVCYCVGFDIYVVSDVIYLVHVMLYVMIYMFVVVE